MNVEETVKPASQHISPAPERYVGRTAVCTLFEGEYHLGLGALVNSLVKHGYQGVIWAGYRGPLPPWASPVRRSESFSEFQVNDTCVIRFVPLAANVHFAHLKPEFMLKVLQEFAPHIESLLYFDPDIVIKCRWTLYEEWSKCGIGLVQDVNGRMTSTHPFRAAWKNYAERLDYFPHRDVDFYCNSGFISVERTWIAFLETWCAMLRGLSQVMDQTGLKHSDPSHPFHSTDQDALNIAIMCTDEPLSVVGPEGMDFIPGGFMMSHAIGGPKPWRKRMLLSALGGVAPRTADKLFWDNVNGPIRPYGHLAKFWKRLDLAFGSALGRFIRRA